MSVWERLRGHRQEKNRPPAAAPGWQAAEAAEAAQASQSAVPQPRDAARVTAGWRELQAATAAPGAPAEDLAILDELAQRVRSARQEGGEVHLGFRTTASPEHSWEVRATADYFASAVRSLAHALEQRGALPDVWLTLVRPWHTIVAGEPGDNHAIRPPWRQDAHLVRRAHHAALAHGQAARALRAHDDQVRVGVVLDLAVHVPADENRGADHDAVYAADVLRNHLLLGPLMEGALPRDLVAAGHLGFDLSAVQPGDLGCARARLDLLGLIPPETWVLTGEAGHRDALSIPMRAELADPADTAQALHDQLRAFDVAHEGLALLVDLSAVQTPEVAEGYAQALERARQDAIPVVTVVAPSPSEPES